MTVRKLTEIHNSPFQIVVKACGECFKYECRSDNQQNHNNFIDREIYKTKVVGGQLVAYCW
jgi:hypothetical protein